MKRRRVILIIVTVLLLGGFAFNLSRPKEPSYEGRTLTEWVSKYKNDCYEKKISPRYGFDSPQMTNSVSAIRAIGTNGYRSS
ncbi:MAG: domain containing protein [Pedosphaera sp.]|nr:domain containing protein [Pedosphaera sp.]